MLGAVLLHPAVGERRLRAFVAVADVLVAAVVDAAAVVVDAAASAVVAAAAVIVAVVAVVAISLGGLLGKGSKVRGKARDNVPRRDGGCCTGQR